ncbi:MAG: penicillin-binding protein 1B [Gammaproteobacteria bacterium]|nr:penicillin-binding protein 1B [Gammaproteobacteria bacterium]
MLSRLNRRPPKRKKPLAPHKKETLSWVAVKFLGLAILSSLIACVIIGAYLDREIRLRLANQPHALPAHIYAKPLEIEAGRKFSLPLVVDELKKRGYQFRQKITEHGNFVQSTQQLDISLNAITSIGQPPTMVRLFFSDGGIQKIIDHRSGKILDQVFLEPLHIGSLHLGSYEDRVATKLHQVPESLIRTLLLMEDRNFQYHIGVDPKSIIRALLSNLRQGRSVQGGSTLTQQLVKNLFLTPERTLVRKIVEAFMAIVLEMRFSKSEILETYLNEVFLGQSGNRAVHGFGLASKYYFGRPVEQLALHEMALLVGMIPAPSYFNPRRNPDRAKARRNLVLSKLVEQGVITPTRFSELADKPLKIIEARADATNRYPSYTDYLHRHVRQYYSENIIRTGGLKLYTAFDPHIQDIAQAALGSSLSELEKKHNIEPHTLQGAIVVISQKTGEILSLVGDRKPGFSGFNRAIDAQRPIGSLIKPVVYLTALEKPFHYSLSTLISDTPLSIEQKGKDDWSPQNYDQKHRGQVSLHKALSQSLNIPTVRLGLKVGIDAVIETAHRLGVDREIASFPSTLLGANPHSPLEIAQLYQPIANQGVRVPIRPIRSVHNHRDAVIAKFPLSSKRVVEPDSAFLIDYALQKVVTNGTARKLLSLFPGNYQLAGKTGTTDDFRDSWFAGYSGEYLAVVWVGRDDNKPTRLSGATGALPIWANLMSNLKLSSDKPQPPGEIVFVDVDPVSGLLANYRCEDKVNLPYSRKAQPVGFAPCAGFGNQFKQWFKRITKSGSNLLPSSEPVNKSNKNLPKPMEQKNQ